MSSQLHICIAFLSGLLIYGLVGFLFKKSSGHQRVLGACLYASDLAKNTGQWYLEDVFSCFAVGDYAGIAEVALKIQNKTTNEDGSHDEKLLKQYAGTMILSIARMSFQFNSGGDEGMHAKLQELVFEMEQKSDPYKKWFFKKR